MNELLIACPSAKPLVAVEASAPDLSKGSGELLVLDDVT